jgi:hypothetical protein
VGDEVVLEIAGVDGIREGAEVWLIDLDLGMQVDFRADQTYVFHLGERGLVQSEEESRFVLLAGSPEFVEGYDGLLGLPSRTVLHKSRPNPFTSSTVIRYDLARGGWVSLKIYDVSGALVRVLYEGVREPGCYEVAWDARNNRHEAISSGLYFCRLETAGNTVQTIKMVTMK